MISFKKFVPAHWHIGLLLFFGTSVYLLGLNIDLIDVDAAQYASIAMEMLHRNEWLQVTERGVDYLDKPPLLFWLTALSFKIFGLNNIAYKLPALLFSGIAFYATYRLAFHLHGKHTACWATVVLGTSIGMVWINMDVKTDILLMGAVIFSIYHGVMYLDTGKWRYLIAGSVGVGLGMLAKGPLGAVAPAFAIGCHLIQTRNFKILLRPGWFLGIGVVLLMLLPMCIGLYQQFDLHPEKVVHGRQGISGLRFYFWEQSFGRFTGENRWQNKTDPLYLFHSALLLNMPWSFLSVVALFRKTRQTFLGLTNAWTCLDSVWIILVVLSFSSYKIPHYAMVVFPLLAILTAGEIARWQENGVPVWIRRGEVFTVFLCLSAGLFVWCCFPPFPLIILSMLITGFLAVRALTGTEFKRRPFMPLVWSGLLLGIVFNGYFMARAEQYLPGCQLAQTIKKAQIPIVAVRFLNRSSYATEFYLKQRLVETDWTTVRERAAQGLTGWYVMGADMRAVAREQGLQVGQEYMIDYCDLNRIRLDFLNPYTRDKNLNQLFLVRIDQYPEWAN